MWKIYLVFLFFKANYCFGRSLNDQDCKDSLPKNVCQQVLTSGMCNNKKIYSKVICPKTCGFCPTPSPQPSPSPPPPSPSPQPSPSPSPSPPPPSPVPACEDKLSRSFCEYIKQSNYCMEPAMNTNITCNQTCGFCTPDSPTPSPPLPPSVCKDNLDGIFCKSVFENGLCFSNDIDFTQICRQTCQFCQISPSPPSPSPPLPPEPEHTSDSQECGDYLSLKYCESVKINNLCQNPLLNTDITCNKTCGFCTHSTPPSHANSTHAAPQDNPKKFSIAVNIGILSWSSVLIVWGIVSGIVGIYSANNCGITAGIINLSLSVALLGFALDEVMLLIQDMDAQFLMLIFLITFNSFMTILMGTLGINAVYQRRIQQRRDNQQQSIKCKLIQKNQIQKDQTVKQEINYEDYIF